ncbi:MAG TPA: ribosomal-processing cysteine protease Prp [Candidatus Cybelea sp.]
MLEVTFFRDEHNRLAALHACGHADFDEYGQDIVCAAISAVLQAARLGLEHYAGGEIEATQESGRLRVECAPSARDRESVAAILTAAELAVAQVARRYPEHVSLACERIAKT